MDLYAHIFIGISLLITLANLVILGLNIKLYTEYFKDRSQLNRKKEG